MDGTNRAVRQAILAVCGTLRKATIPWGDAIADLEDAMRDPDAEAGLWEIMRIWQTLTLGEIRPLRDKVRLAQDGQDAMDREYAGLNARQVYALTLARGKGGRLTAGDLREACPSVSPETIRIDLQGLCLAGKMEAQGEKRGRVYRLL